ncbi:Bacitracin export ATP-binding protein BceA [compost metagenome]
MVLKIAIKLGVDELLKKYPYEVSGGQKQRVACARAVVTTPKLILADEPTGALDSKSAQMLLETISDLNKTLETTILMVTHDAFAASYCKRILFIKDGTMFTEMIKGGQTRKQFFNQILDTIALLGGDVGGVR